MIESVAVTVFPVFFLIVLFGGGHLFRRKGVDMGGSAPIDKRIFSISKFGILLPWGCMVACGWNNAAPGAEVPGLFRWIALALWVSGFTLLFIGRFGLGDSFRIGAPKESTRLKVNGLFRFSRNPMYVGVNATLLASVLYTRSPVILSIALFIAAVHHWIVLAEERYLLSAFGEEYAHYCHRVKQYL
jgi:protein-S-isoprenylcysteine O-methyltransferase Ste14